MPLSRLIRRKATAATFRRSTRPELYVVRNGLMDTIGIRNGFSVTAQYVGKPREAGFAKQEIPPWCHTAAP
ncbi:MAG TPA: hypothetical protein VGD08_12945 [Stellaceae bacterium]|jgi:hypothetical protein